MTLKKHWCLKVTTIDVEVDKVPKFLLLCADNIVLFAKTPENLQKREKYILLEYWNKWKIRVRVNKTKVVVFKGIDILRILHGDNVESVYKFCY